MALLDPSGCPAAHERRRAGDDDFVQLHEQDVLVRTGKQALTIPTQRVGADTIDLRVIVRVEAGETPRMGFDLEL